MLLILFPIVGRVTCVQIDETPAGSSWARDSPKQDSPAIVGLPTGGIPMEIAFVQQSLEIYWRWPPARTVLCCVVLCCVVVHCAVLCCGTIRGSARHLMLQILLAGGQEPVREGKRRKGAKKGKN